MKGNLYLRTDSSHPTRFANAYPSGQGVKVYTSFTNSGAGTYDPTADQKWSTMFGEIGSYLGVMTVAAALSDATSGKLSAAAKALATAQSVPSDVTALLAVSPFVQQGVGAGYLT